MGAIGMTYEQAGHGRAGLGIITENNTVLTLTDRIAHHTTTGLSTVEMASNNTAKMLQEFEKFFVNTNLKYKNFIVRGSKEKLNQVISLLNKHDINYYFSQEKTIKAFDYEADANKTISFTSEDLVIPTNQPKGKMVKVLFEKNAKLSTNITYDITAWSIPYAYGLQGFASEVELTASNESEPKAIPLNKVDINAYAYIHTWNEVLDATFLGDLLEKGFNVRTSESDFSVDGTNYKRGTFIVIRGENEHITHFDETLIEIANNLQTTVTTASTGFVTSGFDFGSSSYSLIQKKKVAVLSGEGTSSASFGEIWHFFEQELHYPLNVLNTADLNRIELTKYQVLILPNGYRANDKMLEKLTEFTINGGTIIAIESALNSFADKDDFLLKRKKLAENKDEIMPNLTPYNEREKEAIENEITGSIFKSTIDNTHPLGFGYSKNYYSLKLSSNTYQLLDKGYNVGYFPENSVNISGFAGKNTLELVSNSLLFGIERKGKGSIIYMVDNPLFRGFWENGKLFFTNAIFFN
jgi:hypothetical protein